MSQPTMFKEKKPRSEKQLARRGTKHINLSEGFRLKVLIGLLVFALIMLILNWIARSCLVAQEANPTNGLLKAACTLPIWVTGATLAEEKSAYETVGKKDAHYYRTASKYQLVKERYTDRHLFGTIIVSLLIIAALGAIIWVAKDLIGRNSDTPLEDEASLPQ